MREYGQVQCSFWQSDDAQAFSDAGKLLAAYLMTGPHSNGIGCYRLPDGYVMADFGWTADKVSKAFEELSRAGFAYRFETIVVMPKFMRWNLISNVNVGIARQREFEAIPKGDAKALAARALLEFGNHLSDGFRRVLQTVSETISKGYAEQNPILSNPTQPEPNQPKPTRTLSAAPTDRSAEVERVFAHWQSTWGHPSAKLDDKRRTCIARMLKLYSEADLCECITGYRNSPHHLGENNRNTVYDSIELLLRDAQHIDAGLKFYAHPPRTDLSEATRKVIAQTEDWKPPEVRSANA